MVWKLVDPYGRLKNFVASVGNFCFAQDELLGMVSEIQGKNSN